MDEEYAPIINFVNTQFGLVRVGIKVPPAAYYGLNAYVESVWQDYLGLLHEQVKENLSELSQGKYPED